MKAMADTKPKVKLMDAVHQVLVDAKGACSVADIAEALYAKGIIPKIEKKTQHHLYTRLHRHIQENGDSLFKKAGRGMFCAVEHYKESEHGLVELGTIAGVHSAQVADGRPRCCGNCAFITYDGPGELSMFGGSCDNQTKSSRWYVRSAQEPCLHWRPRPADRVRTDRKRQQELLKVVQITNLTSQRTRR